MQFLIEKIELIDGEYWGRKIRLKLVPISSLQGTFIKLKNRDEDPRYVANGQFKKSGYNNSIHKILNWDDEAYVTADFYLTFLVAGRHSIDDIQFLHDEENFNYVYDSRRHQLSGHIHLTDKKFELMWDSLVNKTFPTSVDLFIPHEYYSKYDYYVQPWTPWDLSELESVTSHQHGNPSVPILNYGIQYSLLETNEFEITKKAEQNYDKLNKLEVDFLYRENKLRQENLPPEKILNDISRHMEVLRLFLLFIIIIQILHFFL
jgi:hypothetical protein